jgi:hypothetical protein
MTQGTGASPALAIEHGVLGCLLLGDSLPADLREETFCDERHKVIFETVKMLRGESVPDDLILIETGNRLRLRGMLDGIGGIDYLTTLIDAAPNRHNLDYWLPQLLELQAKRVIKESFSTFITGLDDSTVPLSTLIETCKQTIDYLAASRNGQHGLPAVDNAQTFLADRSIVLPTEIIKGVLHQSLKGVIGSSSKARKTWILLDVAISVATGTNWWLWPTERGRVMYINFEIPRAFIRQRIDALCRRKGINDISNLDVWTLRGKSAALWQLLPLLISRIQKREYVLVIIDPIYKGLGGRDENSAGDISQLCNELERIAVETGAAVLFGAHFSKGNQAGKESIDRIGGSGVFTRDADSIITLTKHEEENAFTVDLILRNLPEQPPFVVKWAFPLMLVSDELDPNDLKQSSGGRTAIYKPVDLLSAIQNTSVENPVSISSWAISAEIPRTSLVAYLPGFRSKGWVKTVGSASSARQYLTDAGKTFLATHC